METGTQTIGLGSLFLGHAAGERTRRALEERRRDILAYMAANKYTIDQEEFNELASELAGIDDKLARS